MYMLAPKLVNRRVWYIGIMYLPRAWKMNYQHAPWCFAVCRPISFCSLIARPPRHIRDHGSRSYVETTHLLPSPQTIMLLELALVVGNPVLAEDPAADCQYRAVRGNPKERRGSRRGASWSARQHAQLQHRPVLGRFNFRIELPTVTQTESVVAIANGTLHCPPALLMPPALDRLLASPSALRLLRSIVNARELPAPCSTAANCCHSIASRRRYSTAGKPQATRKWRRWKDTAGDIVHREKVLQFLEDDDDVSGKDPRGSRDGKEEALWAAYVAHQERLRGLQGIRSVWSARRVQAYRLPTTDTTDAEILWGTFIKHPELVVDVIDHAADLLKETGQTYPRLYELVMGYWLPRRQPAALDYHHHMLVTLNLRKLPLQTLARRGASHLTPSAYDALMHIYRQSNERNLYDDVVPPLIDKGRIAMARRWHSLCVVRDDLPSAAVALHPVVQIFTAEASVISNPRPLAETMDAPQRSKRRKPSYDEDLMRRLQGRDTAPVRFEDAFCARMFATRAIPPDSIIKGLAMVGVNEIGPQAVLAMAARTEPIMDLPRRFEELRAAGIALQGSVFILAIEKFAMEQKWDLVRSMLISDQHPDVFGNADVQRKLLNYYLDQEDYVQAHRTLAVLTLFHKDPNHEAWNLLLQIYTQRSGPHRIVTTLQDMRAQRVILTTESIVAIKSLLRPRQRGHKPGVSTRGGFDDLRFVSRVFMTILEAGMAPISPASWREIIRRFGMSGRFRELRRLLLWLVCWYAPRSNTQFSNLPKSPFLDTATAKLRTAFPEPNYYFHFPGSTPQQLSELHPIRQLLRPSLLQGLIIWGFKAGLLPNAHLEQSILGPTLAKKHYRHRLLKNHTLNRLHWSEGLRTVVQLRDLGVKVWRHNVIKALQAQLIVMFGRGHSKRRENRVMEKVNHRPYLTYVREINATWGASLFREPQLLGTSRLHTGMWHPRLRRRFAKPSVSLVEMLGRDWQRGGEDVAVGQGGGEGGGDALEELQSAFAAQEKARNPDFRSALARGVTSKEDSGGHGPVRAVNVRSLTT
ncbi:hypothetical protein P153DRAFT_380795 [Dothidotthia symphoricarpi CBS 119687]|uniref:Pentatricopeptide repeat domain-containing protein n=1 Tax=Dothidotthia symphoricarpi CBS 119687 TaxID=1392245 RepID=A0A6A6AUV8_9PLEO|nr:uncharacterized protein P153DRAFT_380795 [Dothidotthia symphoricarpi CBS 119687]KAF2134993.1 hypothetical protein P153DRAFT_380795 [Dothidotthia symphoricarpi CBS 119687]